MSDDEIYLKHFSETIFSNSTKGQHIVQLPFKEDKEKVSSNVYLAYARLIQHRKMLQHKPKLLKEYHKLCHDQVAREITEEVHEKQLRCYHYLAHHSPRRTAQQQQFVVFITNGSARTKHNPTTNDLLIRELN
ncbi:hypothetical protein RB195_002784 [Necator americanus]|uniref:Uncharacterized protein n=1 Tax=Necator americanus TaxID=51031 RepID=A0ABR1DKN8_NECAM